MADFTENVDHEVYFGRYHISADGDKVTTREGAVDSGGVYDANQHIGMCLKCLGATIEYDTGFWCLHCAESHDIESGPNREIYAPGIGYIMVNAIGERL